MHIPLVSTWSEIGAYLAWNPNQLAMLRVVNLVPMRHWHFTITFARGGKLRLGMSADPALTMAEVQALLSGVVPELLFADSVRIETSEGSLSAGLRQLWESQHQEPAITFDSACDLAARVDQIALDGFFGARLSPSLQDESDIREFLNNCTRFGSHKYRGSHAKCVLNVLGRQSSFRVSSRIDASKASSSECYVKEFFLGSPVGACYVATSPEMESHRLFHSDYGHLDPADYTVSPSALLDSDHYWTIEFASPRIRMDVRGKLGPREELKRMISSLSDQLNRTTRSPEFNQYVAKVERDRLIVAGNQLASRQERARQAQYVYHTGRIVMKCPASENELVALYMKLEALRAIPFHRISVVEYTPRAGIDALADYQRESVDHPTVLGPVEFEYWFENFLKHEHPESQVRIIICWDFETDDPILPSDGSLVMSHHGEWLWTYSRGGYSIDVVRLSRLPGITVANWRPT